LEKIGKAILRIPATAKRGIKNQQGTSTRGGKETFRKRKSELHGQRA